MIQLVDDDLGTLELRSDPFCVVSYQISSRAVRSNVRVRALADGHVDDTRFVAGRAATVAVRLVDDRCEGSYTIQGLVDVLAPYMAARRRPVMRWSLPGTDGVMRQMTVRGEAMPLIIAGARFPTLACSFVSDGEITSPEQECTTISPSSDTELGREYDLEFDRVYPESAPVGSRLVTQNGNEPAHWTGTIYGPVTDPFLEVNEASITWDENGGLTLLAGEYLTIDTRERTMYFNGDTGESRYDRTNYSEWWWDDLLLQPGLNELRFGDTVEEGGSFSLCWHSTWAA